MRHEFLDWIPSDPRHVSMWRNFIKAMGLLALAMVLALYSTTAGPDSERIGAVTAILALIVALWVGVRFVPRLALDVDWEWLPFFSQYQITRDGWGYFIALTVVVFAAINTSNNLLYMVMAALLAVLLLSGFLSALNFRFVYLYLRLPANCFAGEDFQFTLGLNNHKRMFTAFSFHVDPGEDSPLKFDDFYFTLIPPRGQTLQTGTASFERRGHYEIRKLRSMSRYPFGFLLKTRDLFQNASCICYPKIVPREQLHLSALDIQGCNERMERGPGYDLHAIRDYLPSDSARHVHWKASAKTSTLKTREYAAEESRRIHLAFDRYGHSGDEDRFEDMVSQAASLAVHLCEDGVNIRFSADDWEALDGTADTGLEDILSYLAVVSMDAAAPAPALDPSLGALVLSLRSPRVNS